MQSTTSANEATTVFGMRAELFGVCNQEGFVDII